MTRTVITSLGYLYTFLLFLQVSCDDYSQLHARLWRWACDLQFIFKSFNFMYEVSYQIEQNLLHGLLGSLRFPILAWVNGWELISPYQRSLVAHVQRACLSTRTNSLKHQGPIIQSHQQLSFTNFVVHIFRSTPHSSFYTFATTCSSRK